WSTKFPFLYDQGNVGCCTACSSNSLLFFAQHIKDDNSLTSRFVPSMLFTYFNSRALTGTTAVDAGSTLRDAIASLFKNGVCQETTWSVTRPISMRPSFAAFQEAQQNRALQYARVDINETSFRLALQNKHLIVLGLPVYRSFVLAPRGDVPMPSTSASTDPLLGYHAILLVGYDDNARRFRFRNSWGKKWGVVGYGTIPYAMVPACFDAWTILQATPDALSSNVRVLKP
ncbi:hypothetical protein EBZ80_18500, partial [bacterium]|nr:hypothetical protein [bacterium]